MSGLTWDALLFETWRLATDQPDHVDPNSGQLACTYSSSEDSGGCIIGQALTRLEVEKEVLAYLDDDAVAVSQQDFRDMVGLKEDAPPFLSRLQSEQDAGASWGKAFSLAVDQYPEAWELYIWPQVKAWRETNE